jgi:glycosyltransferase involved in cell wall biosynthesis/predicted O-methyltransferase YrrM
LTDTPTSWTLRDYTSPGLRTVTPDAAFPHMRAGDVLHHPWKYLRRDVPHIWYVDERFPLMGFLNRDEATLLHNIALQFAGKRALEIGSWLGWSTCHLALAGVDVDVIDPAHDDPAHRAIVEASLADAGVAARVHLAGGRSPETIAQLGRMWELFFVDGDHEAPAPVRDTLACLPYAAPDCAFVFHDLAAPAVTAALRALQEKGFHVVVYQTAQIMAMAWRGNVMPVAHVPDPDVAWQLPPHIVGLPISGVDFQPPPRAAYPQLRDVPRAADAARPSVCIVTSEIIGPFKNGGVGTATTGLAETLAADGFRVTVLYTGAMWTPGINLTRWQKHYASRGIELAALTLDDTRAIIGPLRDRGFAVTWLVHRWLAAHPFDVIHFNDCGGEGSLSLVAKKLGLAFRDSLLVVALHSPSRWVLELNQTLASDLVLAAFHYAEQLTIACADVLWSPSRYLLDWVAARDYELPRQIYLQQYAIPQPEARERPSLAIEPARGRTAPPKEVVFFGRLEERKGLRLFCNAIHLLRDELAQRGIIITFLGKNERCAGMPSLEYIARRASDWSFRVRTLTDLGQPEALQYLAGGDKLAVMPSPFDNSPCTIYEALAGGIPFLAARTGGIPELIDASDAAHVLFEYSSDALATALRDALAHGGWIATPAVPQEQARRDWTAMHANWRALLPPNDAPAPRPLTIAAIIDHRAGDDLNATIASVTSFPRTYRLLVLNRAGGPMSVDQVDLLTADPAAIEAAVAAPAEDAVLLIHSGVTVDAAAFATMVDALSTAPVDGFIPAARAGDARIVPPLGGSAIFSLFEGVTFTGAMLVRRDALVAAKQGRALAIETPFLGLADYCVASGARIWPYPEAVLARAEPCAVDVRSALPARIAAYADAATNDRYYMLAAGYVAVSGPQVRSSRRDLAFAAVDLGLGPFVRFGSRVLRRMRRWRH